MHYLDLAELFDRLESTSSRLEMTTMLAMFFKGLDAFSLRYTIYLCQGKLHPDYHSEEFGMSDRLILKTIAFTSGTPDSQVEGLWNKEGDTGRVAESLIGGKKQRTLFSSPLTLERVIEVLLAIESSEGSNSQDRKMKYLSQIMHECGPIEARYLCRIVTGRMRVGAGSMTVMDALAEAFATKADRPSIERAFNITCDLGLVADVLKTKGMDGIRGMSVTVNSPIKVMLAERLPSIPLILERMGGRCVMEYKYDGIRVQAHISKDGVKMYSRRLEDLTSNFPDICEEIRRCCKATDAIVEGECVAIDPESGSMLPFQTVTHRRKKHGMEEAVKRYPVRMFLFDMLYSDGSDLTLLPLGERRDCLSNAFEGSQLLQLTNMEVIGSVEEGETFFAKALSERCEGVMAKSLSVDSVYRAGSRGFLWIKYKKDYEASLTDSFDLVVVGAFYGMGKRAGKYGALLMASFDEDTGRYHTACKLGTGFDDQFLESMPDLLNEDLVHSKPSMVDSNMVPDVWFTPTVVLEVVAAEISLSPIHTTSWGVLKEDAGLGLRFPRFTGKVRDDKGPEECTTSSEIRDMYLSNGSPI